MTNNGPDLPLRPYRALDLTEGGVNWCGKVMADLGADVIKVEPPGGSPTRSRGPFYKDNPHPERSLLWASYCLNKRGITLALETRDGQDLFKRLVAKSDFVLESFTPGYLDGLGLGYDQLKETNPGVILTSVTPFGQSGPHAKFKATDLITWSMGGMQYISGDNDRPPVRISFPQAELHGGAQGAAGSMLALWHRQQTGRGQRVDVSMQVAVIWTLMNAISFPLLHKESVERAGPLRKMGFLVMRNVYPCKDGYISTLIVGGALGARSTSALVRWMDEDGMAPDFMIERDWAAWDFAAIAGQGEEGLKDVRAIEKHIASFFIIKTKAELYERAITDRILLAPCNTVEDLMESPQLQARDFWLEVYHPEFEASVSYPGPFIKLSETPMQTNRRAPLIGEHNEEVYITELGLSREELAQLKGRAVV